MRPILLAFALVCGILLAACGGSASTEILAEALPLDKTHPAFVFFYTDG